VLVWVSYVYSLLTHRRSDIAASTISAAAAAASDAYFNNPPKTPPSATPVSTSHTPPPYSTTTPSSVASPSPRKQLSFAASIAQSQSVFDSSASSQYLDALHHRVSSLQISSSPNKSPSSPTGSHMEWGTGNAHHFLSDAAAAPEAATISSQPDHSRDVPSKAAARSPLRLDLPAQMPQAQDVSAWYLQPDPSSSNASSVAVSPLPNTAGQSWLIARDSVELASRRMHTSASSPSHPTMLSPLHVTDSVSVQDHLLGVYSPRNPSWSPAPRTPPVCSPSDGPLARALSHTSPFNSSASRSGGRSLPGSRTGGSCAASNTSPGVDVGAATSARMKLQDSLALSLDSPLRDNRSQRRSTTAPSSSQYMRSYERQEQGASLQLEQQNEEKKIRDYCGDNISSHYPDDVENCDGIDGNSSPGQVWRMSADSQRWSESADAERPFTQSLGDRHHAESGGDGFQETSNRSVWSGGAGRRVQVIRVQRVISGLFF
jgi:hypothetical protein